MYKMNKLYNCGIFQGEGRDKHYFEGWYFKHVDRKEKSIISIIPGIAYEDDKEKSHAFIQIIDGSTGKSYYVKYGIHEFKFSKEKFEIAIGSNFFSKSGISLDINREDIRIQGSLCYSQIVNWHSSLLSPNSMGWYAFIPVMECYHGVLSMQHHIVGSLTIHDIEHCFDKGIGYMEKDWGTSFPSSWIWLQSNHFELLDTSFMLSIAKIPWRTRSFTGLIVGLWSKGKLYRFATYTGAKLDFLLQCGTAIELKLSDKSRQLTIKAQQGSTGSLQAPVKGAMTGKIQESINGSLELTLADKKTGRLLLNTKARCCGMEVVGNIQELVSLP